MYDKLTKKDIEKMEQEVEHRKLVVRKEALEDVKEARAHGDLSENFEYKAAKKFKNENESRIRYLERMIKTAQIVEDESGEDEVGLNDLVTVHFEDDGMEEEYKIVTTVRRHGASAARRMFPLPRPSHTGCLPPSPAFVCPSPSASPPTFPSSWCGRFSPRCSS